MQLKTTKKEKNRMEIQTKVQDVDSWMRNNCIPDRIQRRVKNCVEKKWHEIMTVDAANLIPKLPMVLQKDIKRFFWQKFFVRVPVFAMMDDQLLDAMCALMKPMVYSRESYILRKGDPMEEMCFIFWGKVWLPSMDTNVSRTNPVNSKELQAGDFCGEELLTWAFNIRRFTNLPIANETAQALTEVEALVVAAEDLKFLISKLWLQQPDKLRQTFRHYSSQWRNWAAYVIQRAWRHFVKRKLEDSLGEEASRLQEALVAACGTSTSIGAASYASRFAANAVGLIRGRKAKEAEIITAMHLQKPAKPDSDF